MKLLSKTKSAVDVVRWFTITAKREKHLSAEEINKDGYLPFPKGFSTKAIHQIHKPEDWGFHEMVPSLVISVNAKHTEQNVFKHFSYARGKNPTREQLEKTIAYLDNGKYGFCTTSGVAAIVLTVVGLLKSGDHIVCGDDMYSGTLRILNVIAKQFGMDVTMVDTRDLNNIENAIKKNTKLIWTETPTNPTLKVVDLIGLGKLGKRYGILTAVDNTYSTPYLQRPLDLGVDIVVYSLTKFINGHSDVVMGALITNNEDVREKVKFNQPNMGVTPSAFDCYLVLRSLRSLEVRMNRHMENAFAIAKLLESHPKIEQSVYPGLKSHPQYELSKQQTCGPNGMVSFYFKGGTEEGKRLFKALRVVTLAESLGAHQTLINLPDTMTHGNIPKELKERSGITKNLIRLSVGLENVEDLCEDLDQALSKM